MQHNRIKWLMNAGSVLLFALCVISAVFIFSIMKKLENATKD